MQDSATAYHVIRGTLILMVTLAIFGWLLFKALKRSEDPPKLLFKWVVTFFVLGAVVFLSSGPVSPALVPVVLVAAACITILWGASIGALIAKPFTMIYDGGNEEIEPRPFYSIAEAQRKRGNFTAAIAHIRSQLDKFPTDYQGQMLLAEIQAENMDDLPGAEITIQRLLEQPGHTHRNLADALNRIADWHLKLDRDRDAALVALQEIVNRFPNSEFALRANQRIAHLASADQLLEPSNRQPVHVPQGVKYPGLAASMAHFVPTETDPEKRAAEYVAHLEQFPLDWEAREKLAVIYADHFKRLDFAEDQLNQLIEQPNQPVKDVARWLNLLADLQVRHGAGYDAARDTLARIVERFPNLAAAELARNRMELLKLELKALEKSQPVKMGNYEQNIGLKQDSAGYKPRPIRW
ncbi:MAG TPA: tetratricopeptide repeat protein [Verrucomicrobiota bacterium]|nr:tetratricopeptide repeat protein [Verrucomicrobiota bacterium]